MIGDDPRLQRAFALIDDANAADPTVVSVHGVSGPKELVHAGLAVEWVRRLRPDAGAALLLAARGHHLRRWTTPRSTYPAGRAGYLRWRNALHEQHARELGELLAAADYDAPTIARAQELVRKDGLGRASAPDDDVQTLEDALCLVFLETQFADMAARLEPHVLARVLVKTARKMSAAGLAAVAEVALPPGLRRLLDEAFARDVVERYLGALAAHDWDALASTLSEHVHRVGPYRDAYDGRAAYTRFLEATLAQCSGYELTIGRVLAEGGVVSVQLTETVDEGDGRLRTDEAVVFDVEHGAIQKIAVYLQSSEHVTTTRS